LGGDHEESRRGEKPDTRNHDEGRTTRREDEQAEDEDEVADRQEEEEEDQRSPMPACHRQIRSDGKADEEAKYREDECQETEEETLPQKAHSSDLTSSELCAQVQDSTLCGVLLLRGNPPSKYFFSTKIREQYNRRHRSSLRVC